MFASKEQIGSLIGAVRRSLLAGLEERLVPLGLGSRQFWILVALHEQGGLSSGELSEWLRVDLPGVSRMIAGLRRRGLVSVKRPAEDRRRVMLALTARGSQFAEAELVPLSQEVRATLVQGMDDGEKRLLRELLLRVLGNVQRWGDAQGTRPVAARRTRHA